jgi:hypothetical protein
VGSDAPSTGVAGPLLAVGAESPSTSPLRPLAAAGPQARPRRPLLTAGGEGTPPAALGEPVPGVLLGPGPGPGPAPADVAGGSGVGWLVPASAAVTVAELVARRRRAPALAAARAPAAPGWGAPAAEAAGSAPGSAPGSSALPAPMALLSWLGGPVLAAAGAAWAGAGAAPLVAPTAAAALSGRAAGADTAGWVPAWPCPAGGCWSAGSGADVALLRRILRTVLGMGATGCARRAGASPAAPCCGAAVGGSAGAEHRILPAAGAPGECHPRACSQVGWGRRGLAG